MTDYNTTSTRHKDLVCGMDVSSDRYTATYEGKCYYFCAAGCKAAFEEHPRAYINKKSFFLKRWWDTYLKRLNKVTGGKSQCCH